MTKEVKQQFTLRIAQANPTQMIVILYEMLLCYLDETAEALAAADDMAIREAARKARGCLNELIQSLHMEYDLAPCLMQLYMFCLRRLAHAEKRKEAEALSEIRRVIVQLHDAYEQIEDFNNKGAVMNNSQVIYAGLTYTRTQLTENMTNQGANRGMLA